MLTDFKPWPPCMLAKVRQSRRKKRKLVQNYPEATEKEPDVATLRFRFATVAAVIVRSPATASSTC